MNIPADQQSSGTARTAYLQHRDAFIQSARAYSEFLKQDHMHSAELGCALCEDRAERFAEWTRELFHPAESRHRDTTGIRELAIAYAEVA